MQLASFKVENFRSIASTPRIKLTNPTILLGPNNEGKSNLLRALSVALTLARSLNRPRPQRFRGSYDWATDYPIGLQGSNPSGKTLFRLEFVLNQTEKAAFRAETGVKLTTTLPLEIEVGATTFSWHLAKQGLT